MYFQSCACDVEEKEDENQDNTGEKNPSSKNDEERIKCLKNKLQRVQAKLCESRNTCASLRQDINKAQKVYMFLLLYNFDQSKK